MVIMVMSDFPLLLGMGFSLVKTVRFCCSFFLNRSEFYADSESDVGSDRKMEEIEVKVFFRQKFVRMTR